MLTLGLRMGILGLALVLAGDATWADDGSQGPLGQWPDFVPMGYITAPHPNDPTHQTHLYGDWGGIVGEEFVALEADTIRLFYHSYHETYLTWHLHAENLLPDWALGYDPVTKIKYTPLVRPGGPNPGPAWVHTDTPAYFRHPLTAERLIYNTVRPGTKQEHPEWEGLPGWEGAIQVATSDAPPTIGQPFQQNYENILVAELPWEQGWNHNGTVKGGLSEPSAVWVPHLGEHGKVRLFYRGLHGAVGSYWNWRISYADSDDGTTNWVKNPVPVWDPSDPSNPAYRWTLPYPDGFSFRGAWQASCTGDSLAGGVHMVMTVSNQNYAGGGALAYYWSPDWGDTWFGHPDNPIIVPGQYPDGVPATGFQRTPALLVDEAFHRYVLVYNAGLDADEPARRRSYLAQADRPVTTGVEPPQSWNEFRLLAVDAPPGEGAARLDFAIPAEGRLAVSVYAVTGRRITALPVKRCAPGQQVMFWDRAVEGSPLASGIYLLRARLETRAGTLETRGRLLILR